MKKTVKRIFALFMSLLLLPSALAGVTSLQQNIRSVLRHVSGEALLAGDALIAADVDGDGEVTSDDATIITQYSTGEITVFPIEV